MWAFWQYKFSSVLLLMVIIAEAEIVTFHRELFYYKLYFIAQYFSPPHIHSPGLLNYCFSYLQQIERERG